MKKLILCGLIFCGVLTAAAEHTVIHRLNAADAPSTAPVKVDQPKRYSQP